MVSNTLLKSVLLFFLCLGELNVNAQSVFEAFAKEYKPSKINFVIPKNALNDILERDSLSETDINSLQVIFLKQYLYHLRCCNQSYNLEDLFDSNSKVLLETYTKHFNVKSNEGISSKVPFIIAYNARNEIKDRGMKSLIKDIKKELRRVDKYFEKDINN